MYIPYFVYQAVNGHLDCFNLSTIVSGVPECHWFKSLLGYMSTV